MASIEFNPQDLLHHLFTLHPSIDVVLEVIDNEFNRAYSFEPQQLEDPKALSTPERIHQDIRDFYKSQQHSTTYNQTTSIQLPTEKIRELITSDPDWSIKYSGIVATHKIHTSLMSQN